MTVFCYTLVIDAICPIICVFFCQWWVATWFRVILKVWWEVQFLRQTIPQFIPCIICYQCYHLIFCCSRYFCAYLRSFQNETIFADFPSTHFSLHLRIGLLALVWPSHCVLDYDELQNHLPTLFEFVITSAKSECFIDHIGRPNIIPCRCLFILISLPFHVTFTWWTLLDF